MLFNLFLPLWYIKLIKNYSIDIYFWFRTMCFPIYLTVNSSMSSHQTVFWCIRKCISMEGLLQGHMRIITSTLRRHKVLLYIMVNCKIKCNSDIKNTRNFYSYTYRVREHDGLTWYSEKPCTPVLIMSSKDSRYPLIQLSPGFQQEYIDLERVNYAIFFLNSAISKKGIGERGISKYEGSNRHRVVHQKE